MSDVKFEDYRVKVKEAMNDAAIAFLHEASGELVSQTIRNTVVDKSQLKGSWDYRVDESNLESKIGSPLENAIWEEFGTGEYALEKNGRKTPWYVPVKGYTGKKKPTYNGKVVIVYGKDGTAFYKTNGKKPKRMLFTAFETQKRNIKKMAEEQLKSNLK